MKNKYLIIAAFFLSVQSIYALSNSFLKIFDNGTLGLEYTSGIFNENDSIYLFSSGVIDKNIKWAIKLKSISKETGAFENLFTDNINQTESYFIENGSKLGQKYFYTGFHKTSTAVLANNYFLFGFKKVRKYSMLLF